jgi:hypothetical protein
MVAEGWGVVDGDVIDTSTIMDTRIGAMVNWLCRERGALMRSDASDEDVEALWEAKHGSADVRRVEITVLE